MERSWIFKWEKEQSDVVSPHLHQADLVLQLTLVFLLFSLKPWAPLQLLLQPLWMAGDRWAWVEKGLQNPRLPKQRLPAPGVHRSQAVEPANLTYLEVEEEEELLSFHACKIQCRKALAADTVSLKQTNRTTLVESVHFPEAFSSASGKG